MQKKNTLQNVLLYAVLIGYIIMMTDVLFLGRLIVYMQYRIEPGPYVLNLIPFASILEDIEYGRMSLSHNFLGNIFIFIPAGVYLMLFRKNKRVLPNLIAVFLISLAVEVVQLITRTGAADIDDILLNCIGGLAGMAVYKLISLAGTEEKTRSRIIKLASLAGIPMILVYIAVTVMN